MYNISVTCQVNDLNSIYEKYFGFPSNGFFVEVGAFDGESYSNTSCLADHGWKGIYIEPIKLFSDICQERHKDNNVNVVNCSIGSVEQELTLYVGGQYGELTTSRERELEILSNIPWSSGYQFTEETCKQFRLETVLNQNEVNPNFDLLVVDVEGSETDVFNSFDLNYWKPKMIIIELVDQNENYLQFEDRCQECRNLREYIIQSGYEQIYMDHINSIFVSI